MIDTADRLAIHELLGLYGHVIDERRWPDMEQVFTADVVYDSTDLGGVITRTLDELRARWAGDESLHPLAHHATNIVVTEDPDGVVRVLSKGIGVGRKGRVGSVVYRDVVVRTEAGWRLSYRCAELRRPDGHGMTAMSRMHAQRRGRPIAMTGDEVDAFLAEERTCRVATVGTEGVPHVAPLWFVWDGVHVWLNSLVRSRRWADIAREPRMSLVVDAGVEFAELRGIEISGTAHVVGEVPRRGDPDPVLEQVERFFAAKYSPTGEFVADGRHSWLRVDVDKLVSWDFRKIPRR